MAKLTRHSKTQLPFWGELLPPHRTSSWMGKTRDEILKDILDAINGIVPQITANFGSHLCGGDGGYVDEAYVLTKVFDPKDDRFIVVVPLCRDIFLGSVDGEGRNIEESIKELYPHAEFLVCVELESEEDESMHEMWIVPKPPANKNVVIDDIGICRNPTAIYRVIGI